MSNNIDDIDIIHDLLLDAKHYGLVSEVVYSSLLYMKNNPDKSILDSINYGYYEWIK